MASSVSSKEDYDKFFDTEDYLKKYYSPRFYSMSEESFHRRLYEELGKLDVQEGGKALEFGCGPSIVNACILSRVFKDITMAEFADPNRDMVMKWLHKEDIGFDWSPIIKKISDLEQVSPEDVAERTRLAIKQVIPCDARCDNILQNAHKGMFDIVVSSFCLEVACFNIDSYRKAMGDLCELVKSGGRIFLTGILGENYYLVGGMKFHCLSLTKSDIIGALESAGMAITVFREYYNDFSELGDAIGVYFVAAVKMDKEIHD